MKRVKAVIYGLGVVGMDLVAPLVEKGVEIVGAIDIDPRLVGKDIGELAGLGYPLNVIVSGDSNAVLSQRHADVALVAVFNQLNQMGDIFEECIAHDLDVVTCADDASYPWTCAPELAAKLDKLARERGVTLAGTGFADAFVLNVLCSVVGACHRVDTITSNAVSNLDHAAKIDAEYFGIGLDPGIEFQKHWEGRAQASAKRSTVEAVAADMGLTPKSIEDSIEPIAADEDVPSKALGATVRKGTAIGVAMRTLLVSEQGTSIDATKSFIIYKPGEPDLGWSDVTIRGVPDVFYRFRDYDVHAHVCYQMVNRIPDIINCPPGLVTLERLPRPKYRAFPLGFYLTG